MQVNQDNSMLEERKGSDSPSANDEGELQESYASSTTPGRKSIKQLNTSPRMGGKVSRVIKKVASQSTMHQNSSQQPSGSIFSSQKEGEQRQLFEVSTEKLLLSNDKVTISDLWKSQPQPSFPPFFLKLLDLPKLLEEAQQKQENLQNKIEKRKLEEKRRETAKIEKAAKEREDQIE